MFIDTRSTIRTLVLELENTPLVELLNRFQAYQNNENASEIESLKDILIDESHLELIRKINQLFGYGGAIHNFKNYVIRRDDRYINSFYIQSEQVLENLDILIDKFPSSKRLEDQINDIRKVVLDYQDRLQEVSRDKQLNISGSEFDQLVRVDDSDAITALNKINYRFTIIPSICGARNLTGVCHYCLY